MDLDQQLDDRLARVPLRRLCWEPFKHLFAGKREAPRPQREVLVRRDKVRMIERKSDSEAVLQLDGGQLCDASAPARDTALTLRQMDAQSEMTGRRPRIDCVARLGCVSRVAFGAVEHLPATVKVARRLALRTSSRPASLSR